MDGCVPGKHLPGKCCGQQHAVAGEKITLLGQHFVLLYKLPRWHAVTVDKNKIVGARARRCAIARGARPETAVLLPHVMQFERRTRGIIFNQLAGFVS